jgi:hypothetical protein
MRNLFTVCLVFLFTGSLFAQNSFEGSIDVFYVNEKATTITCEIKVKGDEVYLKQNENGNNKYDRFVINLKTRELYTISTSAHKVIIKYNLDSLISFYDNNKLKEGFVLNPGFSFKATDKPKTENGTVVTKYTGETDLRKATVWTTESSAPVNQLIPFLRLLGNWNEGDGQVKGQILETEISSKVSKKDSHVKVTVKIEPVAKEMFLLPKTYLQKDFSKLMQDERNNTLLKTIVQTFSEF